MPRLGALAIYFFCPAVMRLSETLRVMELAAVRSKDRTILWEYEQPRRSGGATRGDFLASRPRLERLSTVMRHHAEGAAHSFPRIPPDREDRLTSRRPLYRDSPENRDGLRN